MEWPMKPGVLTPAYMEETAKRLGRIELLAMTFWKAGYALEVNRHCLYGPEFRIQINKLYGYEQQVATFIHELIHIAFFLCGYYDDVEGFVQEAGEKFYKEHPEFSKNLFEETKKLKSPA